MAVDLTRGINRTMVSANEAKTKVLKGGARETRPEKEEIKLNAGKAKRNYKIKTHMHFS